MERVQHAMQQALALTRDNLEAARRSVLDLRAVPLQGRNLVEALSALVAETRTESLQIEFQAIGEHRPLPARIEMGLYRAAEEALVNIRRHAQAGEARLQLVITPERVLLIVEDDGQGFDPAQVPAGRYGLVGMNERTRLMGGEFNLESCPGAGTCIEVSVPLG
jgi:two-component system NarL family sensor kinase